MGKRKFNVQPLKLFLLALITTVLCMAASPGLAQLPASNQMPATLPQELEQQGQKFYETGQFTDAVRVLQQAIATYQTQENVLGQAMALRNLALVYQQLGQWTEANQAIASSLGLLQSPGPDRLPVLARVLDVQGRLQLAQGQAEQALATWERATQTYEQAADEAGMLRSRINQAQALQSLGFYRRAIATLTPLVETLQEQPDSLTKTVALRSLGDALQVVGALSRSQEVLEESLEIAERLQLPEEISTAHLSLGNTIRAQGDAGAALALYQAAAIATHSPMSRVQAELNQFSLLIETHQVPEANEFVPQLQAEIANLPPSQPAVYAQVNFVRNLLELNNDASRIGTASIPSALTDAAQILATAHQQAQQLDDPKAESYALGMLGKLYEQTEQWSVAQSLSEQALILAQNANASDIAYRWQWQLGRIFTARADAEGRDSAGYGEAIAAYSEAINTLQSLRKDLVAVSPEVQLSFQESVEPVHREFVSLLLKPGRETPPADLEKARQVIESLQLAELDNFFREACLDTQAVEIDEIDPQAAVIYPIILTDRLEVVLSLPQQPLRHYATVLPSSQIEDTIAQLRGSLVNRTTRQFLPPAQSLYDWLIRPVETDLAASGVKTLVFVLDGTLRNIPMAVLHDGKQFLVEQYQLALTPGLQLLNPQPLQRERLSVLTAGLSESRQGFSALPNVLPELEQIQLEIPGRILLNQQFTSTAFKQAIDTSPTPVVHLATHGKFSSKLEQTFILTWDSRIDINQLNSLLQTSDLSSSGPIELLVLSACQTAAGDRQAALGLAGMAVRAGARSTLATLWQVSDEATALLMSQFYEELAKGTTTKAEALHQAQLQVLQVPKFRRHPYYWAPYVLVGNWL